jgi:hypothetical protein
MDTIIEPNDTFDFLKLSLAHPVGIQGGAYFTRIEYNNKPLYIQTTKGQTKQGFVKTGKKYYSDLIFDKNSETLINWFEKLEERCQNLIFDKREAWFQNSLEESDIETAFNSIIRIYKSGKFYMVRTNIKNNHNNLPSVKIYNELEIPLTMNDVNAETNIITILEIQGIKFTSRNFQIEIELKQVMVLDSEPIFDNCLIKTSSKRPLEHSEQNLETVDDSTIFEETVPSIDNFVEEINNDLNDDETNNIKIETNNLESDNLEKNTICLDENSLEELTPIDILNTDGKESDGKESDECLELEIEDLCENIELNPNELKEIVNLDLPLENNLEKIELKKPNQVYFELYKEARTKAKMAKKSALLAFLEAKNIKKTYLIENLSDSDSDIDAEIDNVSESELEEY